MGHRIGLIIYSRLSSSRLPKKALIVFSNKTIIEHVIHISKKVKVDEFIIATSNKNEDSIFQGIGKKNNFNFLSGSLENVAERTINCIDKYNLDYFVRINGDSPIVPFRLINQSLKRIKDEYQPDIITNLFPRSFPYGYSVEIIKSETFKKFYPLMNNEQREHITKFFYDNHKFFEIENIQSNLNLKKKIELTIDDDISLKKMKLLFEKYPLIQEYNISEIINAYNA